jgi:hypothetical protein
MADWLSDCINSVQAVPGLHPCSALEGGLLPENALQPSPRKGVANTPTTGSRCMRRFNQPTTSTPPAMPTAYLNVFNQGVSEDQACQLPQCVYCAAPDVVYAALT